MTKNIDPDVGEYAILDGVLHRDCVICHGQGSTTHCPGAHVPLILQECRYCRGIGSKPVETSELSNEITNLRQLLQTYEELLQSL